MCQYSSPVGPDAGKVTDWHLAHLGARAAGGAGLILTEATAISPEGRISPADLGIWSDEHIEGLSRLVRVIEAQGCVPGIQIAHAGAKGSTYQPWIARGVPVPKDDHGWLPRAEAARDHREVLPLTIPEIQTIVAKFSEATRRAHEAGFKVVEIHGAHGYLIHSFLSPATNTRADEYGGDQGRFKFALETTQAVRSSWPDHLPLFFRISATDWLSEDPAHNMQGWTVEQSIELVSKLLPLGVDLIDVSSGGLLPGIKIDTFSGYQLPFASQIKQATGAPTSAVGLITSAVQAESIVKEGGADAVLAGRAFLRDPNWARNVAMALQSELPWPKPYDWAVGPR